MSEPPAAAGRTDWRVTSGWPDPVAVGQLLAGLPEWFGIPEAVQGYIADAAAMPTYLAWRGPAPEQPAGVLLLRRHFQESAEIHLMAVRRELHRQGAGRALVEQAEADLSADGVNVVQVKTLGPTHPDVGYALTRRFYAALGFRPLEEIHGLWPGNPCLIMVKMLG